MLSALDWWELVAVRDGPGLISALIGNRGRIGRSVRRRQICGQPGRETAEEAARAVMSTAGLRSFGASLGCGLIAVVPSTPVEGHCPLQEVEHVLRWLAANFAGQCGPCVNGLPALATAFESIVAGDRDGRGNKRLDRLSPLVAGRGGCKMPDGAVRFLQSVRRVFDAHIRDHRRYGSCQPNRGQVLPTPSVGGWR
jgi:NADH:ubiquinone oxidoreductase subunit F (NADH-binding)